MYNIFFISLTILLLSFISCVFLEKINKKILKVFIIILLLMFFSFISFEVFHLLFCYNNIYLTVIFMLIGIIFAEFLNILLKNKKLLNNKKIFLNTEFLYFFSQGALLKFTLDMQYSLGIKFLIIIFVYNFFRNLDKFENKKNIIFINSLYIILGSIVVNIFFNITFIFVSFLWGFVLYMLSDEIIVYLNKIIKNKN